MTKTNVIYIYPNHKDFLNQLEKLNDEYNTIEHYWKYIPSMEVLNNQLDFLNNYRILTYTGSITNKTVIITIEKNNIKYCINYRLKKSNTRIYSLMIRYLRKREY